MPREYIHWAVVSTCTTTSGSSRTGDALRAFPALAPLGALALDVPYFRRLGSSLDANRIADRLHGTNGEDTLAPVRSLLERLPRCEGEVERQALTAFALGLASHVATDCVFHPAITYLTGNYYDRDLYAQIKARAMHRRYEVYLDAWGRAHSLLDEEPTALALLRQGARSLELVLPHWAAVTETTSEFWRSSFRAYAVLQRLFTSPFAGWTMREIGGRSLRTAQFEALFSYRREEPLPFFEEEFEYRCPMTGEIRHASIQRCYEGSIERSRRYLGSIEEVVTGKGFAAWPEGPSLDCDIVGARSSELAHFAPRPPRLP